jgi:hypothetical protein
MDIARFLTRNATSVAEPSALGQAHHSFALRSWRQRALFTTSWLIALRTSAQPRCIARLNMALLTIVPLAVCPVVARASINLRPGPPGVAVEGDDLLIALPIQNLGDTRASNVSISEIHLIGGHLDTPNHLPVDLGQIPAGGSAVLNIRADVFGLRLFRRFHLKIEGHYTDGDEDAKGRDRNGDEDEFEFRTRVVVPPHAPGSDDSHQNSGTTHQTAGPYPAINQPPMTEENELLAPTPQGSNRLLFPLTLNTTGVKDPGITTFPGVTSDGAVGFVINTQSNGVSNRFPPDPSGAGSGNADNVVLATGNLYTKYSTDGGSTFTTINNLSTVFGDQPDGGYCCDQVAHYIPSIDRIVWLIQTNQAKDAAGNVTGPNSLRVAWAKPSDIKANFNTAWTWFDVSSTFLGLGNDWLDFPDLSTSDGNLYLAVDDVTKGGLVVARISYTDLQRPAGQIVTWFFTDPTKATMATGSHLSQNASGTIYWAGHDSTSQIRLFSWADNSSTYFWRDVNNSSYTNTGSAYTAKAPDGQYWLDPRVRTDAVLGAVVKPGSEGPNQLWFAWTAGRDDNFKQPYVRMVMLDESNFKNVGEFETWNASYAFTYPALSVNSASGEVAMSLLWGGGGSFYMNHAVGFPQDFLLYITTASDVTFTVDSTLPGITGCDDASNGAVAGRCTRSGDYLSLRRVGSTTGLFGTVGYEVNLVDPTLSTDCTKAPGCNLNIRWVEFGRPSDVIHLIP